MAKQGYPSAAGFTIVWSSPTSRANETVPNGGGAILQDLRDGMQEAAASFGDTYNDGSTVLIDPTDLSGDGLHPNNSGHNKKAARELSVLSAF
jgi:lysophospholipase L1-like esterase